MQQSNSDIINIEDLHEENIFSMQPLDMIEKLAFLCFAPSDIALLCNIDEEEFKDEIAFKTTERAKAYFRGKLKYQVSMRITTAKFALKGSPDAEKTMQGFLNKMKEEEYAEK